MEEEKEIFNNKEEAKKATEENVKESEKNFKKELSNDISENETLIPRKKIKKFKKVKKIKKQEIVQSGSDGCLLAILGLIFPYVGIVLYLLWRKSKPEAAISVLKGSAISLLFAGIILSIFLGISFLANYIGL